MDTGNSVIRLVGVKKGEIEVLQENEIRLIEKPRRLVSWVLVCTLEKEQLELHLSLDKDNFVHFLNLIRVRCIFYKFDIIFNFGLLLLPWIWFFI